MTTRVQLSIIQGESNEEFAKRVEKMPFICKNCGKKFDVPLIVLLKMRYKLLKRLAKGEIHPALCTNCTIKRRKKISNDKIYRRKI